MDSAPVEAVEPTTSAETSAPVETKDPKAEPKVVKPRTIDDDLEDVLKKHGGLKYKAGGKEKSITAAKDLTRYLSRIDGTEAAATEALKKSQEADGIKSTLAGIAKLPPRERLGAMQAAGIDPKLIREAVEETILNEDERAKSQAHLTPRERDLQAKLEEREAELSKYEQGRKDWEAEQAQQAEMERITATGKRMGDAAGKALLKAKVSPEHVNRFLPAIADRLDRAERLGLELDEDELAETVLQEHGTLADQFYSGLEISALAERLAAVEVEDPDKPGEKVSRLRLLMRHEAAKIKARMAGGQPVQVRTERPQQRQESGQTFAEKMAAARNFGGGR